MDSGQHPASAHFRLVEPLAGFSAAPLAAAASGEARTYVIGAGVRVSDDDGGPCLSARSRCSVRRLAAKPYLQCEHRFPEPEGWLEVWEGERLIDRAELERGWQHSAVSIETASPEAELELVFRTAAGGEAEGVLVRSVHLSDEWGRGRRRRLKCHLPFQLTAVFADFSVFPCCGRQWLNGDQMAGSTLTESLGDIWNGPQYQRMREQFLAKDYGKSCREDICPVLRSPAPPADPPLAVIRAVNEGHTIVDYGPLAMHHDIDRGCNLECTMCRDTRILPDKANVDRAMADIQSALDLGALEEISFSGAGEIFVMAKVVRMLESDAFSSRDIMVSITTNLTHFNEKLWRRIGHNEFKVVMVSADGCSSETYDSIRIGAKWKAVEENMRFIAKLRRQGKVRQLVWNYTVQRENVGDVAAAIRKARELGFDNIRFIAQLGALSRTGGNMFEDHDLQALDTLYDSLESENAFEDPLVIASELGVHDRRYRGFDYRLELARHIFERHGYARGDAKAADHPEWSKCLRLIEGLIGDVERGTVARPSNLTPWAADFLADIASHSDRPLGLLNRLRRRSSAGQLHIAERRVRRWSRALLRTAPPVAERSGAA
jgi:MoaA/NifB/PqqE/SkfB family radical SAM enzyme